MEGRWRLRAAGLVAAGSLATHQLSYLLAGDVHGLVRHSHSYVPFAAGLVAALLLLACAGFIRTIVLATRGIDEQPPPAFKATWGAMAAALLVVFVLQEWIESWVAPNHPTGFSHVIHHVGWLGLLLTVVISAGVAALLRGAHAAIASIARRHAPRLRPRATFRPGTPPAAPIVRRIGVLAGNLAGRAPPLVS